MGAEEHISGCYQFYCFLDFCIDGEGELRM